MAQTLGTLASSATAGLSGIETYFISLDDQLRDGETVTGVPIVLAPDYATMIITNPAPTTEVMTSGKIVCPIGRGVDFTLEAQETVTAVTPVVITCTYTTSLSHRNTVRTVLYINSEVDIV